MAYVMEYSRPEFTSTFKILVPNEASGRKLLSVWTFNAPGGGPEMKKAKVIGFKKATDEDIKTLPTIPY